VACHEPTHHVLEAVAPWFARRMIAARWAMFTPQRSVRCLDDRLLFGPGVPAALLPAQDGSDEDWLACYTRVFGTYTDDTDVRPALHA
jgi:DNA polymerase